MTSLVEAIDGLLLGWVGLCVPRRIEGGFIICMDKTTEGIVLHPAERIVASNLLWNTPTISLVLLSWIHFQPSYSALAEKRNSVIRH